MRLIDADKALEDMADNMTEKVLKIPYEDFLKTTEVGVKILEVVKNLLNNAPTVDAVSADQGEWIVTEHCSNEYGFRKWIEIECPFCGERPTYENFDNMNFCPNCGAKMDGGAE